MTASALALVAALAVAAVAVFAVASVSVVARRAMRALGVAEDQLRRLRTAGETEVEALGREAGERLDRAVARAEAAVAVAETAARIAEVALTAPVVKARAWGAGAATAARTFSDRRALRRGSD
ncbi:MAG: hypothetical protein ABIS47_03820 [Acidimicrobiales bacterium]